MTAPGRFCCCGDDGGNVPPPSGSDCDDIAAYCKHPTSIVLEWEFAMKYDYTTLGGLVLSSWDIRWTVQAAASTGLWGNYDVTTWSGPVYCRSETATNVRLIDSDFSTPAVAGVAGNGLGTESCRLDAYCSENADPDLFNRNWGVGLRDYSSSPGGPNGTPPEFNRTLNGSPDGTVQPFMSVVINLGSNVETVEKSLSCELPDQYSFDRDQTYIDWAVITPTGTLRQVSDWEDGIGSNKIIVDTFINTIRRVP